MKQAYRANKSGEVFYVDDANDFEVTLRNPLSGAVRTIRGTTLRRSYTLLSQEELQMFVSEAYPEMDVSGKIGFQELLGCKTRADFEAFARRVLSSEEFVEVNKCPDAAAAKKLQNNAKMCFRENVIRYQNGKEEFFQIQEELKAHPQDLDLVKALDVISKAMQKYTDKMLMYFSKMEAAQNKIDSFEVNIAE